jgi:hypothetical protein
MLPPLSVARFMLIYIASLGLSYRIDTSLFTENTLVAVEAISEVIDLPAWWKVSLQGNFTASLSYFIVSNSSQESISFILLIYILNKLREYLFNFTNYNLIHF